MVEFISNNSRYIIEDGFIKRLEKKDKLLEVVFIDKINWIWLLGDYGVLSICKVQLHMNCYIFLWTLFSGREKILTPLNWRSQKPGKITLFWHDF